MGRYYGQLSLEERCTIAHLYKDGDRVRQIAANLDRAPSSSLSRAEAQPRHSGRLQAGLCPRAGPPPGAGQARAWSSMPGCAARPWPASARLVARADRRPAAPAGTPPRRISHESIYRFIYAQVRRTNDGAWRHYLPTGPLQTHAPPETVGGGARATTSSSAVFPSTCGPTPSSTPHNLRPLGSRSHDVRYPRPGRPRHARTEVPYK